MGVNRNMKGKRFNFIYVLLTAVLFTTLEPVSKLISEQVHPVSLTFLRFFIGSVILLPFAIVKIRREKIALGWRDYLIMAGLGVLCVSVSMVLLQYAVLKAASPAPVGIIISSCSVFTMLLAAPILKERITPRKCVAVALCLGGIVLCADFRGGGAGVESVVLAVLAALTFALYTVLGKKYASKAGSVVQTSFSFFFGSIVLLAALLILRVPTFSSITQGNLWHIAYLSILVTGVGYWSYFRAMEGASAMAAATVFFIKPVLTPLAAFFINGIVPGWTVFAALALVLAGSYLVAGSKSTPPESVGADT